MPIHSKARQIKVDPEFAEYLEEMRDVFNAELDLRIGIPDVTRVLLKAKNVPRVIVQVKKRSGRGGKALEPEDLLTGGLF